VELYSYFRSSASFRVRIALALKGLAYDYKAVHLIKNEQLSPPFSDLAPSKLVPLLVDGQASLTQSLAIIEYLDEIHPQPPLLPGDALARARVRALALEIACEIHPLNNLRVLKYLTGVLNVSEHQKIEWYAHWVHEGLLALETRLASDPHTGQFCHGVTPTLADICLIPQLANARRVSMDLALYPTLLRVEETCNGLTAFADAAPAKQPDAA